MPTKKLIGKVVAKSGPTVTVVVKRNVMIKKYHKLISRTKKFLVHDDKGQAKLADSVEIVEARPISKKKSWRIK